MSRLLSLLLLGLLAGPVLAQPVNGTLDDADPSRDNGARYDAHTVTLRENQRLTVRMTSDAFDTYLVVRGPRGEEYTNDDFEGTRVSQVEIVAPSAGTWTIWASSYTSEGRGAYTLETTAGAVARVETIEGRLDPRDEQLPKGEYFDLIERPIRADGPFTIELLSYGFDGFLVVRSPSGRTYRNDDDGDAHTSRIRDLAPEPGTWKIWVTTAGADAMGAYDLRIVTF
ncbi:MAG TPA: PPC domain-containing protein [Rhodothermales bacterium]|nr:PPC domain-containing protein [Rhodothermales bacterium]